MKTIITGTIHQGNLEALKQIMRDWASCARYAYQRIHRELRYRLVHLSVMVED